MKLQSDRARLDDKIRRLRDRYDFSPWFENTYCALAAASPPGTIGPLGTNESFAMLIKDIAFTAYDVLQGTDSQSMVRDLSTDSGLFNWWTGQSVSQVNQAQNLVATSTLLGSYIDAWRKIPSGLYLAESETWQAQYQYGQQSAGGGSAGPNLSGAGQVNAVLRGWKLHPKGRVYPRQHTTEELEEMGFEFEPHTYSSTVTVTWLAPLSGPGFVIPQLQTSEILFNCPRAITETTRTEAESNDPERGDFVLDYVSARPSLPPVIVPGTSFGMADILSMIPAINVALLPQGTSSVASLMGGTNIPLTGGIAPASPPVFPTNNSGSPAGLAMVPWPTVAGVDYSQYVAGQLAAGGPFYVNPIPRQDTLFDISEMPYTIKNLARWNFNAQPFVGLNAHNAAGRPTVPGTGMAFCGAMTLECTCHGKVLVKANRRS